MNSVNTFPKSNHFLKASICFFILSLLLFIILFVDKTHDALSYGLSFFLFGLFLIPLLIRKRIGRIDFMEPIYCFSFIIFFTYGLAAVFLLLFPENDILNVYNFLPAALAIVTIGLLFFILGYYSKFLDNIFDSLPKISYEWSEAKVKFIILFLYLAGWLANSILIFYYGIYFNDVVGYARQVSLFTGIFFTISAFRLYSLALLCILIFSDAKNVRNRWFWKCLFWIILFVEILFVFPTGAKGAALAIILIPLIGYHYLKGFKSLKPLFFIALFTVLLIFPVITVYRSISLASGDPTMASLSVREITINIQESIGYVIHSGFSEYLDTWFPAVIGRLSHISILATLISKTPEVIDFKYGQTYLQAFTSFIPRFIWPDRPASIFNNDFARNYGFISPSDFLTVVNISALEELYINFYIPGVVIGMFLIGLLMRNIYRYFIQINNSTLNIFIYIFVFLNAIKLVELPFAIFFMGLWRELVVLLFIVAFVKRRKIKSIKRDRIA